MALTAASAVFKGRLVDVDARWNVICESVDCRTPIERGVSTVLFWWRSGCVCVVCAASRRSLSFRFAKQEKLDWQKTDAAKSTAGAGGTTRIYKSRYAIIGVMCACVPLNDGLHCAHGAQL